MYREVPEVLYKAQVRDVLRLRMSISAPYKEQVRDVLRLRMSISAPTVHMRRCKQELRRNVRVGRRVRWRYRRMVLLRRSD